jgi:mRNA-degrading endonuclease RelE of RelBE toxin-antitoxin system
MFKVNITSPAKRDLKRLDRPVKNSIVSAIAEYREALCLNPNDERARYQLGLTLEEKGDLRCALGR